MADLDDVIDELYTVPPDTFVEARTAAVAAARGSGDRATAATLGKLRRPSVSAWLANQLVRTAPDVVAGALALGPALREATVAGDRAALRDLSRHRSALLADLAARARGIAEEHGQGFTSTTQRELEATFTTAAGDEDAATALLTGRLVAPLQSAGLGFELGAIPPERPAVAEPAAGEATAASGRTASRSGPSGRDARDRVAAPRDAGPPPEDVDEAATARERAVVEAEQDLATARLQDADAAAALDAAQEALAQASALEQEAAAAHRAAKAAVSDARADLTAAKADVTASGRAVASALARLERARSR